jgi:hypothetical protein
MFIVTHLTPKIFQCLFLKFYFFLTYAPSQGQQTGSLSEGGKVINLLAAGIAINPLASGDFDVKFACLKWSQNQEMGGFNINLLHAEFIGHDW